MKELGGGAQIQLGVLLIPLASCPAAPQVLISRQGYADLHGQLGQLMHSGQCAHRGAQYCPSSQVVGRPEVGPNPGCSHFGECEIAVS
jgi:hypothetical protein